VFGSDKVQERTASGVDCRTAPTMVIGIEFAHCRVVGMYDLPWIDIVRFHYPGIFGLGESMQKQWRLALSQ